jgi:hypothetical protein
MSSNVCIVCNGICSCDVGAGLHEAGEGRDLADDRRPSEDASCQRLVLASPSSCHFHGCV